MKPMRVFAPAAALSVMFANALTGFAQPGLVIVDISSVASSVAANIRVEHSKIPLTVQVPIDIAGNVCGLPVAALTRPENGKGVTCKAKMTSPALDQHVRKQVVENERK